MSHTPVEREEYRPSGAELAPKLRDQEVGRTVITARIPLSRADLIAYAGASTDHNPIHWNERYAREVGLDNVIAHGMLTMGAVLARVTEWAADPGAVLDTRTRFTAPVVVADAESGSPTTPTAYLDMAAVVGAIDEDAGTVRLDITVTCGEETVLGRTQAKVRLA